VAPRVGRHAPMNLMASMLAALSGAVLLTDAAYAHRAHDVTRASGVECDPPVGFAVCAVNEDPDDAVGRSRDEVVNDYRGDAVYLEPPAALTEAQIIETSVVASDMGGWAVRIQFDADGRERLARFSRRNVGHRVAVCVDGALIIDPVVQDVIGSGRIELSAGFTKAEATAIADRIVRLRSRAS
jgi:preprotein translocase subunit SecD